MQSNEFSISDQVVSSFSSSLKKFCSTFNVAVILNRCRIRKTSGVAAKDIFFTLFSLPFLGKDLFHDVINDENINFGKDAVYDFLNAKHSIGASSSCTWPCT